MKISMVVPSLTGGGAERALIDTATLLATRGHGVTIVTLEGYDADAYLTPEGVERVTLDLPANSTGRLAGFANNLKRLRALRHFLTRHRPDTVISYLTRTNVLCLLALQMTGIPVIVTEHNVPSLRDAPAQPIWRGLRRLLYRRAAQVVGVSHGIMQCYGWVGPDKGRVIYNPLRQDHDVGTAETYSFLLPGRNYIVSMGRLTREKGFDQLIRAFKLIEQQCPDWDLLIAGAGELRSELTQLIESLGLQDRAFLPGRVARPLDLFRKCDLFVLSSRSEGFGNVIVEAMAANLPVISVDCDFGPREIISHGRTGILVVPDDVAALAESMGLLAGDGGLRRTLAENAAASLARFQGSEIASRWEELLRRVAPARRDAFI